MTFIERPELDQWCATADELLLWALEPPLEEETEDNGLPTT